MFNRRGFISVLGAALTLPLLKKAQASPFMPAEADTGAAPSEGASAAGAKQGYTPCVTPGIPTLPFEWDGNVKVFKLRAEPVTIFFPDARKMGMTDRPVNAWGYNGSCPGPTIEAVEGDTVRIIFTNNLPEDTTVHWHGLEIPIEMDGVPEFSQPKVPPGGSFVYEFKLEQSGTYFYHSHVDVAKQIGLGMMGFFIAHPRNPEPWMKVDRDYAYFLHMWKVLPSLPSVDTTEMTEFNYFSMNGKCGHGITPMKAKIGEKVRIRVANLSMMAHPIHLHGNTFKVVDTGGGFLPPHQHLTANTTSVSAGEARAVDFIPRRPGKWLYHCHFTHHTMDDMHRNMIAGVTHKGMNMDMGGMHTWIEVT